jgi:hypothetical protein
LTLRSEIVGLCGLLMTVGAGIAADPQASVRVRLYDYARVSRPTLAGAKDSAVDILRRAGVRVEWAECCLRAYEVSKDATCSLPVTALDLQMRILECGMAKRVRTSHHDVGYALLADDFGSIAAVFFDRAVDLERGNLATPSAILGAMMAHEIGHLLLGENHHSDIGVLRASWGDQDLKMIARGQIWFTAGEARRMVSMVSRRNGDRKLTGGSSFGAHVCVI